MTIQNEIDAAKRVLDNLIAQQNRCQHSWVQWLLDRTWKKNGTTQDVMRSMEFI